LLPCFFPSFLPSFLLCLKLNVLATCIVCLHGCIICVFQSLESTRRMLSMCEEVSD
jgi:hypothetical protein